MMNVKDAKNVISNLQERTFICSENAICLDNGYVIVKESYYDELKKKGGG